MLRSANTNEFQYNLYIINKLNNLTIYLRYSIVNTKLDWTFKNACMVWSVALRNKIILGAIKFYLPVETSCTLSLESTPDFTEIFCYIFIIITNFL